MDVQNRTAEKTIEVNAEAQLRLLIPTEIARISVIAANAMRVLSTCSNTSELLPAVQGLSDHISVWYDGLPQSAKVDELFHTPWDETRCTLSYVHMGHLGAITLIFRRTLSMYKHRSREQQNPTHPDERARLIAIFNDGIAAAKQASHILYLFLGEQAGIRHCWSVMYVLPSTLLS